MEITNQDYVSENLERKTSTMSGRTYGYNTLPTGQETLVTKTEQLIEVNYTHPPGFLLLLNRDLVLPGLQQLC